MSLKTGSLILLSIVAGAVAGAGTSFFMVERLQKPVLAVVEKKIPVLASVNVSQLVAASPKVQSLQIEQRSGIEELSAFAQKANEEIALQKDAAKKEALEKQYAQELESKKSLFQDNYVQKLALISEEMSKLIEEEADKLGYDVVLSKDSIVAGVKDITEEIIVKIK